MLKLQASTSPRRDWAAIVFAIVLPTVVTLAYFVWADDSSADTQQRVYSVAKVLQFAFPVFWVWAVLRRRPSIRPTSLKGVAAGIVFGLAVMAATLALYHGLLKSTELIVLAAEPIREKVSGMGLDQLWKYAVLSLFYSLLHSLLEEYYWRWFVFGQLRRFVPFGPAVVVSSLGFAAHHVVVLAIFFGITSPATWVFSLCVAVGGAVWAWIYERSGSLLGPWLSHLLVDSAIFLVGYDLVRETLGG